MSLYCAVSGKQPEEVVKESTGLDTKEFKAKLAEQLDEKFSPIRQKYEGLLQDRNEVVQILEEGAMRARRVAKKNMEEVRNIIGLNL